MDHEMKLAPRVLKTREARIQKAQSESMVILSTVAEYVKCQKHYSKLDDHSLRNC